MTTTNWWRLNSREETTFTIEWTPDEVEINGFSVIGAVRAKLDSLSRWRYQPCEKASYAMPLGLRSIEVQKNERY